MLQPWPTKEHITRTKRFCEPQDDTSPDTQSPLLSDSSQELGLVSEVLFTIKQQSLVNVACTSTTVIFCDAIRTKSSVFGLHSGRLRYLYWRAFQKIEYWWSAELCTGSWDFDGEGGMKATTD